MLIINDKQKQKSNHFHFIRSNYMLKIGYEYNIKWLQLTMTFLKKKNAYEEKYITKQ